MKTLVASRIIYIQIAGGHTYTETHVQRTSLINDNSYHAINMDFPFSSSLKVISIFVRTVIVTEMSLSQFHFMIYDDTWY